MRKKQANLYFPDKKFKEFEFISQQEYKYFKELFQHYDQEINLLKLKDKLKDLNSHVQGKLVYDFMQKLCQRKTSITFNQYMAQMSQYLGGINRDRMLGEMLDQEYKGQLSKQALKQILSKALGREILPLQMNDIMIKLFDTNQKSVSSQMLRKVINNQHNQQY